MQVIVEAPHEVIKEVEVEVIKETVREVPIEVIREVEKVVYMEAPPKEVVKYVDREVSRACTTPWNRPSARMRGCLHLPRGMPYELPCAPGR